MYNPYCIFPGASSLTEHYSLFIKFYSMHLCIEVYYQSTLSHAPLHRYINSAQYFHITSTVPLMLECSLAVLQSVPPQHRELNVTCELLSSRLITQKSASLPSAK